MTFGFTIYGFFRRWTLLTLCCDNKKTLFFLSFASTPKKPRIRLSMANGNEKWPSRVTLTVTLNQQQQQPHGSAWMSIKAKQTSICTRSADNESFFSLCLSFEYSSFKGRTVYEETELRQRTTNWIEMKKKSRETATVQWHALAITFDRELIISLQMRSIVAPQSMPQTAHSQTLYCPADCLILSLHVLLCPRNENRFFFLLFSPSILQR